ncbi:hypothetical protein DL767_004903 [Monosporascus sp. MG133]|nr:hypothetical protein DL767_004903 [Monosporascus sp. MG133]
MNFSSMSFDRSELPPTGKGLLQSLFLELGLHGILALAAIPAVWWMFIAWSGKPPILNPKKLTELTMRGRLLDFGHRSKELFLQGRRMFQKKPYRVNCEWGDVVVLHPDYIDEIRNDPRMNFAIPTSDDLHSYIPGFDPFVASDPFARVISPKDDLHTFVARMSSLVFMGEELCRDQEWIEASSDWIKLGFRLRDVMGQYPRFMRPYIHWFMPSCWELRRMLKRIRAALAPHLKRREEAKAEAAKEGRVIKYNDCIEWFSQEYQPGYDPAVEQMTLSLVANHTTSDLTLQTMLDIAVRPHLFKPLREEIISVLGANGLKKTSLYKLKLMDSVLKETQRMKPVMIATDDVRLSDGFLIKKGTRVVFENTHMWDEKYYENPLEYDAYRWVKVREDPAREHLGHLRDPDADFGRDDALQEDAAAPALPARQVNVEAL